MIKYLLLIAVLFSGFARAENEMNFVPNEAGGFIFFTYSYCVYVSNNQRVPDSFYTYGTDSAGNRIIEGCYKYKYPFYFVNWNNGSKITINVNNVTQLTK